MNQPNLFAGQSSSKPSISDEQLMLYALGEFQARGKVLAERDLPLDRLRGAVRRAAEVFGVGMPEDEPTVNALSRLGAQVSRVPPFIAKHPFRIIVPSKLAEHALGYYQDTLSSAKKEE